MSYFVTVIWDYDCMAVGFTSNYTIIVYHHKSCEFDYLLWLCVLDTTIYKKSLKIPKE